jgi:hypothetical protein
MSETFMVLTRNDADRGTLSGGSWESEWPLAKIQTPGVFDVARSTSDDRPSTAIRLQTGRRRPYRVVELINHNLVGLDPLNNDAFSIIRWRVRSVYNPLYGAFVVPPLESGLGRFKAFCPAATLASSTNVTGAVATVQDANPYSPDGNKLAATVPTADTMAHFTFDAGNVGLKAGSGCRFLVGLSRTGGGGTNPTFAADLYQSGVFRSTLVTGVAVSSTTAGVVSEISFNSALLSGSPKADNIELRLRGTASATATVEFQSVMFCPEIASRENIEVTESDWITPELPLDYFEEPQRDILYSKLVLDQEQGWDEMWIEFDIEPGNRDEYVQIGKIVVGGVDEFEAPEATPTNPEYPFRMRRVDNGKNSRGKTGALITEGGGATWREVSFRFPSLSMATALDTIAGTLDRRGRTGRMLWIFPWFEIWAVAKTLDDTSLEGAGHNVWSRGFSLEEAL